eukprot:6350043-Pyramimonas_sp.AAC.1
MRLITVDCKPSRHEKIQLSRRFFTDAVLSSVQPYSRCVLHSSHGPRRTRCYVYVTPKAAARYNRVTPKADGVTI